MSGSSSHLHRLYPLVLIVSVVVVSSVQGDALASALCRAECINQFLEKQPKNDKECNIQPDCFLCWEHCGLLSRSNSSRDTLCKDTFCSEGCEVACGWFRSKRQLPKERLVFPREPTLEKSAASRGGGKQEGQGGGSELLHWVPVQGASLYSVSLVYLNRTVGEIAQTVANELMIPESQLMKAVRIVVIAVNESGALGLANYGLSRRMVKKTGSAITAAKLKEVLNMTAAPPPLTKVPPFVPTLWLSQGKTESLDGTIGRTNISWEYLGLGAGSPQPPPRSEFLVKWWTPHLNMEGRIVVNSSNYVELTYLSKYFSFVKVKVLGTDLESQILVLRKEPEEYRDMESVFSRHWILLLCINFFFVFTLILVKALWSCNLLTPKFVEKSQMGYDVYT